MVITETTCPRCCGRGYVDVDAVATNATLRSSEATSLRSTSPYVVRCMKCQGTGKSRIRPVWELEPWEKQARKEEPPTPFDSNSCA